MRDEPLPDYCSMSIITNYIGDSLTVPLLTNNAH
jgi:hypothetical protein